MLRIIHKRISTKKLDLPILNYLKIIKKFKNKLMRKNYFL